MKSKIQDLAILGGEQLFGHELHVGRPNIGNREKFMERVNAILDNRWFTNNGPHVQQLEEQLSDYLGVEHCILLCNGTTALEIAIRGLDLSGEVIIPSFTFVATAHALQWQQITPVFCDVAPGSHHIDPDAIERHITPKTTAIMGVHVWGETCDTTRLAAIAAQHRLKLLYDAAHALGCSNEGRMIGNFGDAEVFSFHATKFFNTFEGGAITTNNAELAQKIRFMRNFGFAGYDDVRYLGINGKMSEVSAAMGLSVFESLEEIIDINEANYHHYETHLQNIPGVRLFPYNEAEKRNYQYIIVEINEAVTGINRDTLTDILHRENILARRYFYPGCHQMEPYRSFFPYAEMLLPNTNQLVQRVMSLPNGTTVTSVDIEKICDLIAFCVAHGHEISEMTVLRKAGLRKAGYRKCL